MEYRSSVARLLAGLSIGIACAGLLASLALTSGLPSRPESSESYSADGSVFLRLDSEVFRLSPDEAQGIGRGLLESAESTR